LTNNTQATDTQKPTDAFGSESAPTTNDSGKKEFVEPELSNPVSVLEAITFFQNTTSGQTN
jgi:hypothetical protein